MSFGQVLLFPISETERAAYFLLRMRWFVTIEAGAKPVPGYTLTHLLGAGASSEVWEAQSAEGKKLAFKFLDCRKLSPSMIAGEVKLLRSLTGLNHPHIIPLTGVHSWGKYLILMMELADGSLDDLHRSYSEKTNGNVPPDHALDLLEQAESVFLASSVDGGATWTDTTIYAGPITRTYDHIFPALAIDSSGGVWCWGLNTAGQVGAGESGTISSPLQVRVD